MLLTSKGIVLQSFKYGENSLISKVISEERGLISLLSNKTKGKKNKQGNFFQPLNAIQFVCYLSSKSAIHRVKELSFNHAIPLSPENIQINSLRFFLAEFLSKVIKEEEQNFSLYNFLEVKLFELNSSKESLASFHIKFLIELMDMLGIQPFLNTSHLYFDLEEGSSADTKPTHFNFYEKGEMLLFHTAQNSTQHIQKTDRNRLLNLLINYYDVQLGGGIANIKSKAVLEVVFS